MLRNRAKRKYGTVAQEIQFSEFYRTAIFLFDYDDRLKLKKRPSGGLPDGRFGEE